MHSLVGRKAEPKMEFDELARRLDEAYRTTAARFPQLGVRLEKVKNKVGQELDSLVLTGLDWETAARGESSRIATRC
jgi:hypothetical protein